MQKSLAKKIAFGIGFVIVVGTHIVMLVSGLSQDQMMIHSIANIVAGVLMLWAWV